MKRFFIALVITAWLPYCAIGQQWIDKTYSYDSLLNVPYGTAIGFAGQTVLLTLDIYLPRCEKNDSSSERPLLMWIHGGAFLEGNKDDVSIQTHCKNFARRGYVTASINYRKGFVCDEVAHQCNYPNYSCIFATDSAEWVRAYYRAVQDAKGALRFLVNRHQLYNIDTENIFVAGESAGAFLSLAVGLMDMPSERPAETFALSNVPLPNAITNNCSYNNGIVFSGTSVARPDLGGIDGLIEPSMIPYTIKGIGNFYGGMYSNLLQEIPINKPKPAIYSFHQPCDIIVSIDSNYVFWGLSWCFTNGFNCFGLSNHKAMVSGSRTFSQWNTSQGYGYFIQNDFTTLNFPYSFLFGQGSCIDQINNPCHDYDNRELRDSNLAQFFSNLITTSTICTPQSSGMEEDYYNGNILYAYPNPVTNLLHIELPPHHIGVLLITIRNNLGQCVHKSYYNPNQPIDISHLAPGYYLIESGEPGERFGYTNFIKL